MEPAVGSVSGEAPAAQPGEAPGGGSGSPGAMLRDNPVHPRGENAIGEQPMGQPVIPTTSMTQEAALTSAVGQYTATEVSTPYNRGSSQ